MELAAVVNAPAEAGIADQVRDVGKAVIFAAGGQQGDGADEAKAGELDDERGAVSPGGGFGQPRFKESDLGLDKVKGGQIRAATNLFQGRKGQTA